ncbi:unnamed protein product [Albugo candida]|uniref:Uncharacterized protein n=1 Tax=Albugo candida TaxID=65357 RepID=A0A024GFT5_9STRA|nr:unnamed protein product [Albugo candida]|eukprot:CCI45203.1 unnamed protein product [Albugo candida]
MKIEEDDKETVSNAAFLDDSDGVKQNQKAEKGDFEDKQTEVEKVLIHLCLSCTRRRWWWYLGREKWKRKKTSINYRFIDLKHIDPCSWRRKKFARGVQEFSTQSLECKPTLSFVLRFLIMKNESVCPLALICVDTS